MYFEKDLICFLRSNKITHSYNSLLFENSNFNGVFNFFINAHNLNFLLQQIREYIPKHICGLG